MLISPALGAMFAPLALKFVQSGTSILFSFLTKILFLSVPAQTINPNGPPGNVNSPRKRKIGAIVGGVIGGVAAVFAVISITTFVRRRRRHARPRSIMTLSTDFREVGPELIVTPFDPYYYEGVQDSRMWAEQQPLVSDGPEAEVFPLHRLSSTTPAAIPLPGTPIPVGLSDKEIARLRAEGFNSQQPGNLGVLSSNVLQPMSSPNAVPESGSREAPYDPRRLHSEVETLVRREMERLHAEGLVVGSSPPSYTQGDG